MLDALLLGSSRASCVRTSVRNVERLSLANGTGYLNGSPRSTDSSISRSRIQAGSAAAAAVAPGAPSFGPPAGVSPGVGRDVLAHASANRHSAVGLGTDGISVAR